MTPALGADRLFKVCPPRRDWRFEPSRFWRSRDWESSTTRPRQGYVQEDLLYVGDYDEVTIHLFPRVHTARLWGDDAVDDLRRELGLELGADIRAFVFYEHARAQEVAQFRPTIFHFHRDGFERVRRGEFVFREARRAIAAETLSLDAALARWCVRPCPVTSLDEVMERLRTRGAYFDEQT